MDNPMKDGAPSLGGKIKDLSWRGEKIRKITEREERGLYIRVYLGRGWVQKGERKGKKPRFIEKRQNGKKKEEGG